MSERKTKGCPLLVQSDTYPSMTVRGESHTRSFFLPCLEKDCVAYHFVNGHGICYRFDGRVHREIKED